MSVVKLFILDSIDEDNKLITLVNYVFNKRYKIPVSTEQLEIYKEAFGETLSKDLFLSVTYDEKRGVIVDG